MSNQIVEQVAIAPNGTYKLYHGSDIGHDEDSINTHLSNLQNISEKIQKAIDSEFYIEALSLRLQIVDFWLRVFYRNKRNIGEQRQREFGRLIDQCKKLGMDQPLVTRLKDFNTHRVNAIHGYVIGKTTYENLAPVVTESKALSSECIAWILENCGEVIDSMEGKTFEVGDMVLNWQAQIAQLMPNK
jgi:hypothetical protein